MLGDGVDIHVLAFDATDQGVVPEVGLVLRGSGFAHEGGEGFPGLSGFFLWERIDHHAPVSVMAGDSARGVYPPRGNKYR